MKKAVLSMLLAFAVFYGVKAQCTFYGYYVDATGFLCNQDVGQLCILTSADWACNDGPYEVQITFPTGSFIYTDLGDFSVLGPIGATTTLHATLTPISEGTTSYCLEGVIQVPGTVFSAQIVSLNNPNNILNPTTFTLDVANVIGSNVGVPTITAAIAQNLVLPSNLSATTGQRVIIDGNLQITENYSFGNSFNGSITNEIKMMPGASIEVLGGFSFGTRRTNISGCNGQWDRIKVAGTGTYNCSTTRISDAKVAIELLDAASLTFFNSGLVNNVIGIGSFGTNFKTINLNLINFAFGISNVIRGGMDGFHFENVAPLTLANVVVRDMTNDGMYLDKTDLTAFNIWFRDCNFGIHAVTPNNLLSIADCHFEDGYAGIVSQGTLEMQVVDDNNFSNIEYAVARTTAVPGDHTLIENNYFDFTCSYDVLGFVQPSRAEIQYNEIYADRTNVAVLGLGTGEHKWATQYNDNMIAGLSNTNGYNVSLWNTTDARIFHNPFSYSSNYNFHIQGGSRNKVGYNTDCYSDNRNIEAVGSPKGIIYCNQTDGIHGITILNDCAGTDIRGNDMSGSGANLVYGSATNTYANTGTQLYKGNIFDASSDGNPKAINFSSEPVAMQNQYRVGWFAGAQGSALFPFFTSTFDEWFIKDENGSDYSCPPMFHFENPKIVELTASVNANIAALQAGLEQDYGLAIAFDAKLKLYRDLYALQQLTTLTTDQMNYYQTLASTDVAKFINFENTYQNSVQLSDSEDAMLQTLANRVKVISAQIKALNLYAYDAKTETLTVNQGQTDAYNTLVSSRNQTVAVIGQILNPKRQALVANLPAMTSILNGISQQEFQPVQYLKKANTYLVNRLQPSFAGFSDGDRAELQNIARQCASTGGEGVYIARVLLAESTFSLSEYNDACVPSPQPREADKLTTGAAAGMTIVPNPAHDVAVIYLPTHQTGKRLNIVDVYGKVIVSEQIPGGVEQYTFFTKDVPTGIYFVQFEGQPQAIKLVVTK